MTDLAGELALERFGNLLAADGSLRLIDAWNELAASQAAKQAELREIIGNEYMDETARRRLLAAIKEPK